MKTIITIDGPAGGGKSTLARKLQENLPDFVLVDIGSYFRWAAYLCLKDGVDLTKRKDVYDHVKDKLELEFGSEKSGKSDELMVYYRGKNINRKIFSRQVSVNASYPSKYYLIRKLIRRNLRELAKKHNIIIAGRDTGTYTFPDATIKFFLTANLESRAKRRYHDMKYAGKKIALSEIREQIAKRDQSDTTEKDSPLNMPRDAISIDNTNMTIKRTWEECMKIINIKLKKL
ncbi:(d)CMP kinase [Patescibacteria group bacterium]|nr:(d)CMP kinase [Patescibacteria group bacterium]